MRKLKSRKLSLNKTTVRHLNADKLDGVAGGSGHLLCNGFPGGGVPQSGPICGGVPVASVFCVPGGLSAGNICTGTLRGRCDDTAKCA